MTEKETIVALADDCATKLSEHADSVQIFVTKQSDEGSSSTISYEVGRGNFYARQGQVDEWLTFQHEYQRSEARRRDEKRQEEE